MNQQNSALKGSQVILQIKVLEARNLTAKDRNHSSDPYVTIKFGSQRVATSTIAKNLNPKWNEGPWTFVVNRSVVESKIAYKPKKAIISFKVWDKDTVGREFLGQVCFSVLDIISNPSFKSFEDPDNEPVWHTLEARSKSEKVSGDILLKIGYANVSPTGTNMPTAFDGASCSALPADLEPAMHVLSIKEAPYTTNEPFDSVAGASATSIEDEESDMLAGVLCMEIIAANNLPRKRSAVLPRFDMDPFVVISFGKRTFRTKHVRHSLNPQWNEKVYIRVHHCDLTRDYPVMFAVWDYDRLSLHNHVGRLRLRLSDILSDSAQAPPEENGNDKLRPQLRQFVTKAFPIILNSEDSNEANPAIMTLRWRYIEAKELRRNFIWSLARIFDSDENGSLNRIELQVMLDQLGSSLREETISQFFEKCNLNYNSGELTYDQLSECLEQYVKSHTVHLSRVSSTKSSRNNSLHSVKSSRSASRGLSKLLKSSTSSLRAATASAPSPSADGSPDGLNNAAPSADSPLVTPAASPSFGPTTGELSKAGTALPSTAFNSLANSSCVSIPSGEASSENEEEERLFHISGCFFCGKSRVNSHFAQDLDIISHIALCAHDDLSKVDNLVLGGFLTEAQASRKWYVKLLQYISYGNYHVGRRNGVILVLDRATGQLLDEKMPVYIRMGIRLMYQSRGASNAVQSKMTRRLLYKMSVKQGRKFDDPKSVKSIAPFIRFHQLSEDEILEPLNSFKTFNEFFYRKLKPGARTLDSPDDPFVLNSPADCRMNCFRSVSSAMNLWIKGRDFSILALLNNDKALADHFDGGALAVFRLAPQDYHRFHSPVNGTLVSIESIGGTYYTVNPMAIRTTVDVFSENKRSIVIIDSPEFGNVAYICVGAMMVGSIVFTAKVGDKLKRMDEVGYFAFGGSTILTLFEPGKVQFDKDLLQNSEQSLETLVRVGNAIGKRIT